MFSDLAYLKWAFQVSLEQYLKLEPMQEHMATCLQGAMNVGSTHGYTDAHTYMHACIHRYLWNPFITKNQGSKVSPQREGGKTNDFSIPVGA